MSQTRQTEWQDKPAAPAAAPGPREIPATSAQRRMYFASMLLRPGSLADVWGTVLVVDGELAIDRLERALEVLHGRHDALRATFLERGGDVRQVVHDGPAQAVRIRFVDAEGEGREWADAEARRFIDAPFDIVSGPLWRAGVIRLSATRHLLVFGFHHLITDDISVQVFAEELRVAYADPNAPELLVPAAQYADYRAAQKPDREGLDYWCRRLAGIEPARLPEDGSPSPDGLVGARLPVAVAQPVLAEFEAFCRDRAATPFMGLLAVYCLLLQRWAGTSDVPVGTQVLGRPHSALFGTIGFFANTVVLRCPAAPTLTFEEYLDQVREAVHDALDYQDVPFEAVVDALAPQRDADRNPLFQLAIGYRAVDPADVWALPGLRVTPEPDPAQVPGVQFDLTLDIQRLAGETTIAVEFDRRRFSEAAMRRFAAAYAHLLPALCRAPGAPLASIALMDAAARAETLALGAPEAPGTAPPAVTSVWELFERSAAGVPDREAVRAAGERLTFAELAGRARVAAAGLRARGVRAGTTVGICLPRRAELIVAILATWCAGGAFLLLDPQQPPARRRLLVEEAGVGLVIADEPFAGAATVAVAALHGEPPASAVDRPAVAPAYVVFTSGSTGRPKGVVVDQAGVVALATTQLAPMYARLPAGRQVNVGGLSALTFDVFINHCLAMMAFGHRLLLLDDEERTDPLRLLERGSDPDTAIEVLDGSSSQIEVLLDAGILDVPHPPRIVVIGGEGASDRLWRRLRDQPGLLAFNTYGVTECTVESAIVAIGEHRRQVAGRAAGTSRLYIVDDHGQLLPPLFVGEVCIGGLGVAQGYVGRPAHTSERFVADPFSGVPGQRMYRTGDKGRLRPDGQLEFWGRIDDQVKVRGLRVEPGELEAALCAHPDIARAAVVATDPGTSIARLVAYVVPGAGRDGLTSAAVRQFLRGRVPAALLPDRVEFVEAFPVTANGKLDRGALSRIRSAGAGPAADRGVAPAGSRERRLCEIVAEVVGVPGAGPADNFFELGGNSLLAMTLIGRVRTVLGCELRMRSIFESESIEDLAARLGPAAAARPALVRRDGS
nr:hypothetical protein GCM10020063_047420 [Dactylosporangium thailandense]